MSDAPDPRLLALLGADTLASLRGRLRARFERLDPDETPATLNLAGLSASEYEALALLTGAPPRPAKSMRIDLAR
ncbi:MAG: TIGR02679 family protein, partial [Burkholderiales bacterium]|nr:TIGR02679 family protein [Burkholderiales bacterium]